MTLSETTERGSYEDVRLALVEQARPHREELARALAAAVRRDDVRIVELLLSYGADSNYVFPDEWPALRSAIEHEQYDVIRKLVEHGADINLPDEQGFTPLHHSVDLETDIAHQTGATPTADLTKLLLVLGAVPQRRDHSGRTATDLARANGHRAAVEALEAWRPPTT
jgi:ankyrin repeat protein